VELSLDNRDPATVTSYAKQRGISQIAWIDAQGIPTLTP
jgi:hypothetical protein